MSEDVCNDRNEKYQDSIPIHSQLQNELHSTHRIRKNLRKNTTGRINIRKNLYHYDNLPTDLKSVSLLSTLQCFGKL